MTNQLISPNTCIDDWKLELSGSPPKRSVQVIYSLSFVGTLFALSGWLFGKYTLSGLETVLFLSLIVQVVGSFLGADEYTYIDLRTGTLIKKRWYSFMGFGGSKIPLKAFSEIVVEQSRRLSAHSDATFIGFKPARAGPILYGKEFPGTDPEKLAGAEHFARALAKITGIPYFSESATKKGDQT